MYFCHKMGMAIALYDSPNTWTKASHSLYATLVRILSMRKFVSFIVTYNFYTPGLKGPPGASSNGIIFLSIISSRLQSAIFKVWEMIQQSMPITSVCRSWLIQINLDLWKVPYIIHICDNKITENDRCVMKKIGIHWYRNQTWIISPSKSYSHFTDITCLWGWGEAGQNVRLGDFCHILT